MQNPRDPYTGPERRVPLDSKAVRRVLVGLICFWLVLIFAVPALLNVLLNVLLQVTP